MDMTEITAHAQRMFAQAGPEAIAIAARNAKQCEETGKLDEAEDWQRIRASLMERAGPRST